MQNTLLTIAEYADVKTRSFRAFPLNREGAAKAYALVMRLEKAYEKHGIEATADVRLVKYGTDPRDQYIFVNYVGKRGKDKPSTKRQRWLMQDGIDLRGTTLS